MENRIHAAKNNWEPAQQALVACIGKQFYIVFDRTAVVYVDRSWGAHLFLGVRASFASDGRTPPRIGLSTSLSNSAMEKLHSRAARSPAGMCFSSASDSICLNFTFLGTLAHGHPLPDESQRAPEWLPDLDYNERMRIRCFEMARGSLTSLVVGKTMTIIDGFLTKNPQTQGDALVS
ncbi:hypothetical protein B0H19DRAFT_103534 [Mycena capillaripes]|nr:hypothetical protein B0H19DRAFT_103534 [Mycena capillaripes]